MDLFALALTHVHEVFRRIFNTVCNYAFKAEPALPVRISNFEDVSKHYFLKMLVFKEDGWMGIFVLR